LSAMGETGVRIYIFLLVQLRPLLRAQKWTPHPVPMSLLYLLLLHHQWSIVRDLGTFLASPPVITTPPLLHLQQSAQYLSSRLSNMALRLFGGSESNVNLLVCLGFFGVSLNPAPMRWKVKHKPSPVLPQLPALEGVSHSPSLNLSFSSGMARQSLDHVASNCLPKSWVLTFWCVYFYFE
jgi:hypothetical protein